MSEIKIINVKQVPTKRIQTGMLLIEVLFSILIFSFGILGLVGMQAISTKNAMSAEDRTIAASLANDMVAQMWLRKSTDVATEPLKTDYSAWKVKVTATSGWTNVSGTVSTDVTNPAAPLTTVTVNWSTSPTSKASGGSAASPVAHQYATSFSM